METVTQDTKESQGQKTENTTSRKDMLRLMRKAVNEICKLDYPKVNVELQTNGIFEMRISITLFKNGTNSFAYLYSFRSVERNKRIFEKALNAIKNNSLEELAKAENE